MGDNTNTTTDTTTGTTTGATATTTTTNATAETPHDSNAGLRPIDSELFAANGPAGRSSLSRAVKAGTAIKLAPGVITHKNTWDTADWPERRRLRCVAHGHAHPGLVLTGVSAARVHGMEILIDPDRETDEKVHLAHVGRGKTKNGAGHVVQSLCIDESDITVVNGVRATTPARTIHDLRESHGPAHALAAVDDALRKGHGRGAFAALASKLLDRRTRGAKKTAEVMMLASTHSESPAESWSRRLLHCLGIVGVIQQVYIVGPDSRPIRRVDFWIPALEMVIEFHGWKKYDGRYGDGDVISTYENAAMRELANCGLDVVQLTWRMLIDGSAGRLIAQRVAARRTFLEKAGPQFTGETFLRHEKLPDRVTRFFGRG